MFELCCFVAVYRRKLRCACWLFCVESHWSKHMVGD